MDKTYKNIQMLRAIAALCVVLQHVSVVTNGYWGVHIFLVISGFIISYVGRGEGPLVFAAKRMFRIIPIYWLGTLAIFSVAVFAPQLLHSTTASVTDLLKSLFFVPFAKTPGQIVPALYPGWTLNLEMFFYAIFVCGMLLYRRMPELPASVILMAVAIGGTVISPNHVALWFLSRPRMLDFVFGMCISLGTRSMASRYKMNAVTVLISIAVLLAAMFAISTGGEEQFSYDVLAAIIVFIAVQGEGAFSVPGFVLLVGDASYSLYLFHPYVIAPIERMIVLLHGGTLAMILAAPFMVLASVGAAILAFQLIERPSNKWLRRTFLPGLAQSTHERVGRLA